MSTRAAIARIKGDGWEGVYHHWDGNPTALGETLFRRAQQVPVTNLLRFLIDEHPAGWSTINRENWEAPPGFDGGGLECYCHGSRSEEASPITHESDMGMEWAYVFDEHGNSMAVLERVRVTGTEGVPAGVHAVGAFGSLGTHPDTKGRDDAWVIRAVVALNGPEPVWEQLEQDAS